MPRENDILGLIAGRRARRPARPLPELDALFRRLAACEHPDEAVRTEDCIWDVWITILTAPPPRPSMWRPRTSPHAATTLRKRA